MAFTVEDILKYYKASRVLSPALSDSKAILYATSEIFLRFLSELNRKDKSASKDTLEEIPSIYPKNNYGYFFKSIDNCIDYTAKIIDGVTGDWKRTLIFEFLKSLCSGKTKYITDDKDTFVPELDKCGDSLPKLMHNSNGEKRKALTKDEQELFLDYLSRTRQYQHWYPIFYTMLNTGLRVGEITGLRWCDVDLDNGVIDVNHTLVYYNHRKNGCYFNIHTPKTKAGCRSVPIMDGVREALEQEKYFQQMLEIKCNVQIDGYTDFIFLNRFGNVHNQSTLNKALRRIIRDCNDEILSQSNGKPSLLLSRFSCHSLRHTFATRLCEASVNVKVIQDVLGHADFQTTMNIYTDATKDLKQQEFKSLEEFLKKK